MDMVTWRTRMVLLLFLSSVLIQARPASGQVLDDAFRSDIEKLLDVTGSAQMGQQAASLVSGQVLAGLKKARPDIPDRAIELATEVLDSEFAKAFVGPDGLNAQIVSIYAKHFTREDVRGLLAFYSTDLGRKAIGVMPVVFQEAAAVGQQWAEQHMPRITVALQSRLRAEGFIK
jgi:hypothetical protein